MPTLLLTRTRPKPANPVISEYGEKLRARVSLPSARWMGRGDSRSGTVRLITADHQFDEKPNYR